MKGHTGHGPGALSPVSALCTLHHVGIAAADMAATCAVYCGLLGYVLEDEMEFLPQQVRVALLRREQELLEVLEPVSGESAVGRFLAKRGPGLHHLCYAVENLDTALASLLRQGVDLVHAQAEEGLWGPVLFIHPKAAQGVMIELLQHPGQGPQACTVKRRS